MDEPRIWPKRWGRLQIKSATPAKATVYKLRSCEARLAPEVGTFVGLLCALNPGALCGNDSACDWAVAAMDPWSSVRSARQATKCAALGTPFRNRRVLLD